MAGTIIADFIRADANKFSINVGNTIIASVNSLGILSNTGNVMINSSGVLEANSVYYNGSAVLSSGKVQRVNQPVGSVLQVVQSVKTDIASYSGTTWSDITGMSVSITPTSATSKFYVSYDIALGGTAGAYSGGVKLVRNSTDIYLGDASSSRTRASGWIYTDYYAYSVYAMSGAYLDSPATTSSITYKLQVMSGYSGYPVTINYSLVNSDGIYQGRVPCQITVMEIAA